ncbi:MAG TPA: delta-60 repeat domain-containing protein, partial [Blastocatellia bacterium]|nr:delta-60 repeat domain-containing protein [Blastocatellia bacterium]
MTIKMLKGRRRESRLRAVRMATLALILVCSQPLSTWAADGDLDKSFGMGGIVLTQFDTQVDANGAFSDGRTVAIQTDGKIVAGGETDHNGRTMDAALARYNPDGSLDATFGSGGKVITANTQGLDVIAIQSDGKIVAASQRELLRYTTDGSLDPGFGSGGRAATGGALVRALA